MTRTRLRMTGALILLSVRTAVTVVATGALILLLAIIVSLLTLPSNY